MEYFKIGLTLSNDKFWSTRPDAEDQIIDLIWKKPISVRLLLEPTCN